MLLLTDGTVMCQDSGPERCGSSGWYLLVPDPQSELEYSYTNGRWWALPALPPLFLVIPNDQGGPNYAPLFCASAVLRDGRVFVAGGEYNGTQDTPDVLAAAIYDSLVVRWTASPDIPVPAGWSKIGDAPCCVLPDGCVLLGSIEDNQTAIYDPVANTWRPAGIAAPDGAKNGSSSEETWTLLPDQTVLTVQCAIHSDKKAENNAEKYLIRSDVWVSAGATPDNLVEDESLEVGPAVLLPDGRVFAIGATGATALYTMPADPADPGTWTAGPQLPRKGGQRLVAKDAPACLLPNGRVLIAAGPHTKYCGGDPLKDYCPPTYFFEFDPLTSEYADVAAPPNASAELAPYTGRMLLLPTGQVLFANESSAMAIYTPDGAPDEAWKPVITNVERAIRLGQTYPLEGTQLNGLSQACSYGDDAAMATNYPLVRIRNLSSKKIIYCRTANHSTMAVATGKTIHSTQFTVPETAELGPSELSVVANGIASNPERVIVSPTT